MTEHIPLDPSPPAATTAPPPPVRSPLHSYLSLALYLLMAATMLGFTGRLFWWADYFSLPRLHLAAALAMVAVLLLLARDLIRPLVAIAGITLNLVAVYSAILPSPVAPSSSALPPGQLRVLLLNVNGMDGANQPVFDWIRASKPDLLILTETNRGWQPQLDTLVADLPYQRMANHMAEYGMAILSRFPLDRVDSGVAGPASLPVLKAEIESPIGRLAVVAVHANAPLGGRESRMHGHYFAQVSAMVQTNGLPTLLVGDFYAAPWSGGFESVRLLPNLQPASWLQPATWPAQFGPLGLPLSHILLSVPYEKALPVTFTSLAPGPTLPGLDQLPLIADLEIK